ncbi:MAG: TonB-dependent receptor [Tannerella sp.]|jgi:hypothetical protein|nr:TonB-dependent receptor [Tannerella sp.]
MNIRVAAIAITYILLTYSTLYAQESKRVKIFGNVRDPDNNPIELVGISVKGTVIGAVTNEKGYYSLTVGKRDSITLVFSCLGYNKAERIIPQLSDDMRLNVKMSYSSIELTEVAIKASRTQTDMMQSLDPGRIRVLPDPTGGSIESLIVTYAGVSTNNELSSQYSVRGGNYDENIIYVNGLEVFRPLLIRSGQQEGLSFINPEMTANVQFSAGGFEPRFGDKMSSVLDITYKKPTDFEGSASASMLGGSIYLGSASRNFTQVTGVRYKTNRSLLNTMDTNAEYNPDYTDIQTFMTYSITPRTEIDFLGNVSLNNYRFIPHDRQTKFGTAKNPRIFDVYFEGRERDRFQTAFGSLTLKHSATENVQYGIQASAFGSSEEESYDITGVYLQNAAEAGTTTDVITSALGAASYHEHARNRLNATVANVGAFGIAKLNVANTLKFGVNAQYERFIDRISEWEIRDSSGYSLPQTGSAVNVYYNLFSDNRLDSRRYSAYIQDVVKFRTPQGMFTLTGGVRGSYWDYNNEILISPRLSVGFIPMARQNLIFRFATGLYYQPPFYRELRITENDGFGNNVIRLNDKLKSQKSTHIILGGDYTFKAVGRNFKFTTELYYKKLDNINPYTVDNVKIRYYGDNIARGYSTGIDMKFFGEFVEGADSWLSVSLMKSRQTINNTLTVPTPNDQLYNISLYFQDYFPGNKRTMLNLRLMLVGGLPVTIPNMGWESFVLRTPPYRRVDIGFSYQLAGGKDAIMDRNFFRYFKNIWLGIDAFNLFGIPNTNSYYWITDVFNQQYAVPNYLTGRQFNLRMTVDF